MRPISQTLIPPGDAPPAGPSVASQTLPPASATNDEGPAAACACASAEKFSSLQTSGAGGNSVTFFSASGLMTSAGCAVAAHGTMNSADAKITATPVGNRFIGTSPRYPIVHLICSCTSIERARAQESPEETAKV